MRTCPVYILRVLLAFQPVQAFLPLRLPTILILALQICDFVMSIEIFLLDAGLSLHFHGFVLEFQRREGIVLGGSFLIGPGNGWHQSGMLGLV